MSAVVPPFGETSPRFDRSARGNEFVTRTVPLPGVGLVTCITERITDATGHYLYTVLRAARDAAGDPLDALSFSRVRRILRVD